MLIFEQTPQSQILSLEGRVYLTFEGNDPWQYRDQNDCVLCSHVLTRSNLVLSPEFGKLCMYVLYCAPTVAEQTGQQKKKERPRI
jgi:hypothetical protein